MATHPHWLKSLIKAEALPSSFAALAVDFYLHLAESIASWAQQKKGTPLVIGVNGAQGTGKSTLSLVLALALEHDHQLSSAIISIDDIYLTKQERVLLSETVHPLFKTRGVPGTHDVSMGVELIQKLKNKEAVQLPVFDKAMDDRAAEEKWISCDTPVDIIILEGWCVGAIAQQPEALTAPCNSLEESEDSDAAWRTYANEQLAGLYRELFQLIDKLVMLKAPDFECVYQWRSTQEEKLRLRTADSDGHSIMDDAQLKRFIMHYERLTRWMFEEMPARADCLLELNHDHHIVRAAYSQT
jgi:D-glycerate 3-kinase